MKLLLALFLTIPAVVLVKVRCPKDFIHVTRTPTAKNNQTKDWCLRVFDFENMGDRDRARSVCISNNAMLSIPENKAEYDLIIERTEEKNDNESYAMDGQMNPKCKALLFQSVQQGEVFNTTTLKGPCNIKNNLIIFDDANTDPEFVLSHMHYGIPSVTFAQSQDDGPRFQKMYDCLRMDRIEYPDGGYFYTSHCGGKLTKETGFLDLSFRPLDSVICGRPPL